MILYKFLQKFMPKRFGKYYFSESFRYKISKKNKKIFFSVLLFIFKQKQLILNFKQISFCVIFSKNFLIFFRNINGKFFNCNTGAFSWFSYLFLTV